MGFTANFRFCGDSFASHQTCPVNNSGDWKIPVPMEGSTPRSINNAPKFSGQINPEISNWFSYNFYSVWMNILQSTCKCLWMWAHPPMCNRPFMKTVRNPKSPFWQWYRPECWPPKHLTSKSCHFVFVPLDMKDQVQIQNQIQNKILMSDESRFILERVDGGERVWKRRNERLADSCISETDRYGGGASLMVWGGISG